MLSLQRTEDSVSIIKSWFEFFSNALLKCPPVSLLGTMLGYIESLGRMDYLKSHILTVFLQTASLEPFRKRAFRNLMF